MSNEQKVDLKISRNCKKQSNCVNYSNNNNKEHRKLPIFILLLNSRFSKKKKHMNAFVYKSWQVFANTTAILSINQTITGDSLLLLPNDEIADKDTFFNCYVYIIETKMELWNTWKYFSNSHVCM